MINALSFFEDADPIKSWQDLSLKNQRETLFQLFLQVLECCRFLNEFSKSRDGKGFGAFSAGDPAPLLRLVA